MPLQRDMRLWMCETGMANAETHPALKVKLLSYVPIKAQELQYSCTIVKPHVSCTWTHAEPILFSVFKIIPKRCNFTVCNFYITVTRQHSTRELFCLSATLVNIWRIFRKMNLSNVLKHIIYFPFQAHKLVSVCCKIPCNTAKGRVFFNSKGLIFIHSKLFCLIINPFNDSF